MVQYNPQERGGSGAGGITEKRPDGDRRDNRSNGSLIAVSYEARAHGVKRNMRGAQARELCPALQLVQVPTAFGKSDMQIYRDAGAEVAGVLGRGADALEKASVDEVYLDLTAAAEALLAAADFAEILEEAAASHVAGFDDAAAGERLTRADLRQGHCKDLGGGTTAEVPAAAGSAWWARPAAFFSEDDRLLAAGAVLTHRARRAVSAELGFTCSAGVSDNKLMAKLCSGMHKVRKSHPVVGRVPPSLWRGEFPPKLRVSPETRSHPEGDGGG